MDWNTLEGEEQADIDLHGMTVEEADIALIEFLNELPAGVRMVEVTHGYSRGTALKKLVRENFNHWRLAETQVGLNPGSTYLVLR